MDKLTLDTTHTNLTCLAPGWCDYQSKTIHLDHVSTVSFTVSWDCVDNVKHANAKPAASLYLGIHTSTAGLAYDSVAVSLASQGIPFCSNTAGKDALCLEDKEASFALVQGSGRELRIAQPGACASGQKRWQVTTDALKLPGRFAKVQLANAKDGSGGIPVVANISVVATLIGTE